ncbi:DUF3025 domain-containing protein [uncultured Psychrobacter sp.]|uniref:DUF3025 domain-containing protein n=1 Tax=uncultured Psychrobacter sp. TaxID=259303 RepID=UPI00345A5509
MSISGLRNNRQHKESSVIDKALDDSFANIDWQAPWLVHLNQLNYLSKAIQRLSNTNQQIDTSTNDNQQVDIIAGVLNKGFLNTALKQPSQNLQTSLPTTKPTPENQAHTLTFVSQSALPEGKAYEYFIAATGNIPTRDNLHDLFNGSIWLTFPKTKALLNYYHMLKIAKQDIGDGRGRVRDTITVFDENGAILVTSNPNIGKALIDFDWQESLVAPRENWDDPKSPSADASAAVYIFGHALLEQLVTPRKPLCAHSVVINVSQDFFALSLPKRIAFLDDKLANYMDRLLSQDNITPRHLSPLPILGVPHFWAENANTDFYEDAFVFRSGRRRGGVNI